MSSAGVVLHLPESWLLDRSEMPPFYQKLQSGLEDLGIRCDLEEVDAVDPLERIEADANFHIFNHRRVRHPRALNAGVAYIYPFWNLDPWGIRAFSSIGETQFRAHTVDGDKAKAFLGQLRARWAERRESRYAQPEATDTLPDHAVAVFFQSEGHRGVDETCYMDRWVMLETTLRAWPGPVVVKPHPREMEEDVFERLLDLQARYPQLVISQGNIHDILAACARVVTINSAVGIEAYMHRKPVILCGQTDFHHIADTARTPEELSALIKTAPTGRVYAKYLYWYFRKNCVDAGRADVAGQVVRRIAQTGFELSSDKTRGSEA